MTHSQSPADVPDEQGTPADITQPADVADTSDAKPAVRRTRSGGLWVGLIVAAAVLVLVLVFILQNLQTVQVNIFAFDGRMPLAVAILLGVAAGALLIAIPGTVRILQLRRNVRRPKGGTSA